jgi:hypothetical protein
VAIAQLRVIDNTICDFDVERKDATNEFCPFVRPGGGDALDISKFALSVY